MVCILRDVAVRTDEKPFKAEPCKDQRLEIQGASGRGEWGEQTGKVGIQARRISEENHAGGIHEGSCLAWNLHSESWKSRKKCQWSSDTKDCEGPKKGGVKAVGGESASTLNDFDINMWRCAPVASEAGFYLMAATLAYGCLGKWFIREWKTRDAAKGRSHWLAHRLEAVSTWL